MNRFSKFAVVLGAMGAAAAGAPANAATVYNLTFGTDGSASQSTQGIKGAFTAYYAFAITGVQKLLSENFLSTKTQYSVLSNTTFSLYKGGSCTSAACTGGTLLGTTHGSTIAGIQNVGVLDQGISPVGSYYLKLTGTGSTSGNGSSVTASVFTSAVPETAMWAMMLVGFGGIGSVLRGNRRQRVTFAA